MTTTSSDSIATAADGVVQGAVGSDPRVPGVVAGVTDRSGTTYLGAAGKRDLDTGADMTTDTVMAIFSTTKAITGTVALQLVEEGSLTPTSFALPDPEVHTGGHGLYSTVGDYLKFMRMWLNDGRSDGGEPVLEPETVAMAAENHLGDLKVKLLPGVIPALSNDAEFFPGMPKSWALTFMINDEDAPTGRPAGSLAWAGLANLVLLDRPAQRHRRLLGDADLPVRRCRIGRRLPRFRDRGVPRARRGTVVRPPLVGDAQRAPICVRFGGIVLGV